MPSLPILRAALAGAPAAVSLLALVSAASFAACDSTPEQGTLQIVTVDDPFTGPPAATTIGVQAVDLDGGVTTLAAPQAIGSAMVDLGTHPNGDVDSVIVRATDGAGTTVAFGQTLPFELDSIDGQILPVFVQRNGALSRLPNPMPDARSSPLVGILDARYIFEAGGADPAFATRSGIYDLIAWGSLSAPPTFATAPKSLVLDGLSVLTIDDATGTWLDLTSGESAAAVLPQGGAWSDVSGGQTVAGPDGSSYVVGGTRDTGAASSAVLVADTSGTLTFVQLKAARLGAAAGWVDGLGLVVSGGTQAGATTGIEVLSGPTTTTPIGLPFPADPTTGAGFDALDATHILVVGGGADGTSAQVFDLSCTSACTGAAWA
ncbi:MAG TPA: hypothetical protein VGI39_28380, partial [Polyangiaceae bacterium]